jgi:hypothetical protein
MKERERDRRGMENKNRGKAYENIDREERE